MNGPLVSVVIVSWNARQYLSQCLQSLLNLPCRYPLEIIVVDNDSHDGSPEMVERDFPGCQLIRSGANLGFAKANNLGLKICTGKYVCLINSDVKLLEECVNRLVDFCELHREVAMAGPRVLGGDGKLQRSCRGFPTLWNMLCRSLALDSMFPHSKAFGGFLMLHWEHDTPRPVDILSGCFWVVRREALEKVGLLDESFFMYGEDMDWCKRFWLNGWKLMFLPQAEAIHYGGGSSANAPVRFYIEKQKANLQYWKKHHHWPAPQLYFLLICLEQMARTVGYAARFWGSSPAAQERRSKLVRGFRCLQWLLSPPTLANVALRKRFSET